MSGGGENFLLNNLDMLYQNEEHEKIIVFILSVDPEHYSEELSVRLARSMLDSATDNNFDTIDTIEKMLMKFVPNSSDPLLYYQLGRCCFYSDKPIESLKYLWRAKKLAEQSGAYDDVIGEINEFYEVCKYSGQQERCRYSDDEAENLHDLISGIFGRIERVENGIHEFGLDFDLLLIPANEKHGYDIYITFGLGAYAMFHDNPLARVGAEYFVYSPHEWGEEKRREMQQYLKAVASIPVERRVNVSYGYSFTSELPIMQGSRLNATMLIHPMNIDDEEERIELCSGRRVQFMQLLPLYHEELEYKLSYGNVALMQKLVGTSYVVDPNRESVCPRTDSTLLGEEIDLAGEEGEKYCSVSRKIIEEGERVGFMQRIFDSSTAPEYVNESGWVFMAGTENGEFMLNPYNMNRCRLNTVCNIDSDIIPFIAEPADTVVYRTPDGVMRVAEESDMEQELSDEQDLLA